MSRYGQSPEINLLNDLMDDPVEQMAYAQELLSPRHNKMVLKSALAVFEDAYPLPENLRETLLELYEHFDEDGVKRDPSGTVRSAILRAFQRVALPKDVSLLEHAVMTYEEVPPGFREQAGDLRAEALVVLNAMDSDLGLYHAVRLLGDPHDAQQVQMSGQPMATAIRVLASQGLTHNIYQYVMGQQPPVGEAIGEGIRSLPGLPNSLVPTLVDRYGETEDEMIALGLFELLLHHRTGKDYREFTFEFLKSTDLLNVFRYLVLQILTKQIESHIDGLLELAKTLRDRNKLMITIEALEIVRGRDKRYEAAMQALEDRLQGM